MRGVSSTGSERVRLRSFVVLVGIWFLGAMGAVHAAKTASTKVGDINLRGDLELTTVVDENTSRQPFDGEIVLVVHDAFLTGRAPELVALREALADEFVSTLFITLSYGQNYRRRDTDLTCSEVHEHRHEDALKEIDAWFQYLVRRGASRIFLMGVGRGASQVALFALTQPSPFLSGLVLLDPLVETERQRRETFARYGMDLPALRQRVNRSLPGDLINKVPFLSCPPSVDLQVSAGSLQSYYAENANFNTLKVVSDIKDVRTFVGLSRPHSVLGQAVDMSVWHDWETLAASSSNLDVYVLPPEESHARVWEFVERLVPFLDYY